MVAVVVMGWDGMGSCECFGKRGGGGWGWKVICHCILHHRTASPPLFFFKFRKTQNSTRSFPTASPKPNHVPPHPNLCLFWPLGEPSSKPALPCARRGGGGGRSKSMIDTLPCYKAVWLVEASGWDKGLGHSLGKVGKVSTVW